MMMMMMMMMMVVTEVKDNDFKDHFHNFLKSRLRLELGGLARALQELVSLLCSGLIRTQMMPITTITLMAFSLGTQ